MGKVYFGAGFIWERKDSEASFSWERGFWMLVSFGKGGFGCWLYLGKRGV